MNTPAHMVVNLVLLGRRGSPGHAAPVLLGAALPDLPIVAFWAVQKVLLGTPEAVIWSRSYYDPRWQTLFDVFHSIPLVGLGLALTLWRKARAAAFLFASLLLHALLDLPLHHDDAHRHFLPLSSFRFESPVSYWDPAHGGLVTAPLEALAVALCCVVLLRRYPARTARVTLAVLGTVALVHGALTLALWR